MASNLPSQESSCNDNDNNSDMEIFFGKITLQEMKRRFLRRQTIAHPCDDIQNNEENEINVRIIETHSEPDLTSSICSNIKSLADGKTESNEYSEGYHSKTNDSETDVSVEHVINKMQYVLPSVSNGDVDLLNFYYENNDITEFNSEVPIKSTNITIPNSSLQKKCTVMNVETPQNSVSPQPITPTYETPSNLMDTIIDEEKYFKTPEEQAEVKTDKQPLQPLKFPVQRNLFNKSIINEVADNKASVNSVVHENKTGDHLLFKTPAKLPINKTNVVSSLKKTPKKCNNYEHIASPIAAYIKNSPQVPLLKDVKPRKQLLPVSGIPRLKDTTYPHKQHNKENVNLPEIAYRSAKNTKVIDNKDEPRMPQSGKMKKLLSSLPKSAIIKHDHRENMTNAKPLCGPEDSFANLSLHQADLSVCIKKSAMSPTPHKLKK